LRACGGFTVGLQWADGQLISVEIRSLNGSPCHVRYGSITKNLIIKKGQSIMLDGTLTASN